jgi:hypothetical protein
VRLDGSSGRFYIALAVACGADRALLRSGLPNTPEAKRMSTRAVLARPRGTSPGQFEGVYLHNAGGPAEMGPVLWTLLRDRYRFDAAGFSREIIDENLAGWSNIDVLGGPLAKTWDGKTKITVDQHQDNFNEDRQDPGPTSFQGDPRREVPGITSPPINEETDAWGAVFAYVVGPDGLRVHLIGREGWQEIGHAAWAPDEPDWEAMEEAAEAAAGDDEEEEEGGDEDDEGDASPEGVALRAAARQIEEDDLAGAQATLVAYHTGAAEKSQAVFANLLYTMTRHTGLAPDATRALLDEGVALVTAAGDDLEPALLENLCIVLNNAERFADTVRACEAALANDAYVNAGAFTGYTYAALRSKDRALMQRVVARVEQVKDDDVDDLTDSVATFDNMASMYVALGDKAKALEYVALCKEHDYEHYDEMPAMEDYAAIKDDPDFKKLFR